MLSRTEVIVALNETVLQKMIPLIEDHLFTASPEFVVMEAYDNIRFVDPFSPSSILKPLSMEVSITSSVLEAYRALTLEGQEVLFPPGYNQAIATNWTHLLLDEFYSQAKELMWDGLLKHYSECSTSLLSFEKIFSQFPSVSLEQSAQYLGVLHPVDFMRVQRRVASATCFPVGDTRNLIAQLGFAVVRVGDVDCVASERVFPHHIYIWWKNEVGVDVVRTESGLFHWSGFQEESDGSIHGELTVRGNFRISSGSVKHFQLTKKG